MSDDEIKRIAQEIDKAFTKNQKGYKFQYKDNIIGFFLEQGLDNADMNNLDRTYICSSSGGGIIYDFDDIPEFNELIRNGFIPEVALIIKKILGVENGEETEIEP